MEWLILFVVIAIGLSLLILEFLVLPGGIAGIIGFACVCFGIYLGYHYFGTPAGHYVFLSTTLVCLSATVYAVRAKTWRKLSLNASIDSSVDGVDESVHPGDTGLTIGRLAPMGKVRIGNATMEAQSQSGYIDENREVEVVKVFKDKIVVKLK
ncbi:hypothetical protein LJC12_02755 [Odoribacter sp. OttesenSCG-928-J03]|nr:hypothetical protein [Odoribacter sp. OttesenSCG-928-J03]MDL2283202.1 hypothetical protein [Odoribacter sp. OttesenSCG-928-G04]